MTMTDRALTTYRYGSDGVAIPEEEFDETSTLDHPILKAIMSGRVPQYIHVLIQKHQGQPEAAIHEYDQFAGVAPADFMDYINREVEVIGCMMLPHGPTTLTSGEHSDGWWKCYLMLKDKDAKTGSHVVIGCSGQNIMMWVALAVTAKGWGVWPNPIKVALSGNKDSGYRIRMVDRPTPTTRVSEHKA